MFGRIGIAGDCLKYRLPIAAFAPSREAIVDRLVRSVFTRAILPTTANPLRV